MIFYLHAVNEVVLVDEAAVHIVLCITCLFYVFCLLYAYLLVLCILYLQTTMDLFIVLEVVELNTYKVEIMCRCTTTINWCSLFMGTNAEP